MGFPAKPRITRVGDPFYTSYDSADLSNCDDIVGWTLANISQVEGDVSFGLSHMRRLFNRGDLVQKSLNGPVLKLNRISTNGWFAQLYLSDGSVVDPTEIKLAGLHEEREKKAHRAEADICVVGYER